MAAPGDSLEGTRRSQPDTDLSQSLTKLSLSSRPSRERLRGPSVSPQPRAQTSLGYRRPTPSSSNTSYSSSRDPLSRSVSHSGPARSPSATPSLLRKASMNSLHSASGITPSRRTSWSHHGMMSPRSPMYGDLQLPEVEEKPVITADSLAHDHFEAELQSLHTESSTAMSSETTVFIQDACYGHRFARLGTNARDLSGIVERPERLQAAVTGISLAYVRLGERHADGKYPIEPNFIPTSVLSIPFGIRKTSRVLSLDSTPVTNVHGKEWVNEMKLLCEASEDKLAKRENELERPQLDRGTGAEAPKEIHHGDMYLCGASRDAFEGALGAVCEGIDAVFSQDNATKRAFVAIRPPGHHCESHQPQGFCWINNVLVGINHAMITHGATHAAIFDIDLHHGDGSQAIAMEYNQRSFAAKGNTSLWKKGKIGYFSLHDVSSYPCEMGDLAKITSASTCVENALGQTIWNVHLDPYATEVEFWSQYQSKYSVLLEKGRTFLRRESERLRASGHEPKSVIFISAGFDASEWESPGMQRHGVHVPTEFYARFTRDVRRIASEDGLGVDCRIVSVMEGGYSDRAIFSGVFSHLTGLAGNDPITTYSNREEAAGNGAGVTAEMSRQYGTLSRRSTISSDSAPGMPYDSSWWSKDALDQYDSAVNPLPTPGSAAPKPSVAHTYASPTQASAAKMTEIARARRRTSERQSNAEALLAVSRAPSPPPPEVHWTVAARALSKVLIPQDRTITSNTQESLKVEEKKPKREVVAESSSAAPTPTRMSLRDRKPPPKITVEERGRRKSVAGHGPLEKASNPYTHAGHDIAQYEQDQPLGRRSPRAKTKPAREIEVLDRTTSSPLSSDELSDAASSGSSKRSSDSEESSSKRGRTLPKHNMSNSCEQSDNRRPPSRRLSSASTITVRTTNFDEPPVPEIPSGYDMLGIISPSPRPGSSMSVRTNATMPEVRRTRTPARGRPAGASRGAKKPSRPPEQDEATPKQTPAKSRAQKSPSRERRKSPVRKGRSPQRKQQQPAVRSRSAAPPNNGDSDLEMKQLTEGVNRVSIKVVTKEMKEARARAEKEKQLHPPASTSSATTPKLEMPAEPLKRRTPSPAKSPARHQAQLPTPEGPPASLPATSSASSPMKTDVFATPVSPSSASPSAVSHEDTISHVSTTDTAPSGSEVFVPCESQGPAPKALPLNQPLEWLPVNQTETPRPPTKRGGHTFTPTSHIPFAGTPSRKNGRK